MVGRMCSARNMSRTSQRSAAELSGRFGGRRSLRAIDTPWPDSLAKHVNDLSECVFRQTHPAYDTIHLTGIQRRRKNCLVAGAVGLVQVCVKLAVPSAVRKVSTVVHAEERSVAVSSV